jgi:hypothetical protein
MFQHRSLAFRKTLPARATKDHPNTFLSSTPTPETKVALATNTVIFAFLILTTKLLDRLHGHPPDNGLHATFLFSSYMSISFAVLYANFRHHQKIKLPENPA